MQPLDERERAEIEKRLLVTVSLIEGSIGIALAAMRTPAAADMPPPWKRGRQRDADGHKAMQRAIRAAFEAGSR